MDSGWANPVTWLGLGDVWCTQFASFPNKGGIILVRRCEMEEKITFVYQSLN